MDDVEEVEVEEVEEVVEEEKKDEEELTVTIGDEEPEEKAAPDWVKELRIKNREQGKELKKAQAKLAELEAKEKEVSIGERPKIEDFDYDQPKYDDALLSWHERKRRIDEQKQVEINRAEEGKREYQESLNSYAQQKVELNVPDFEEAEDEVQNHLSTMQQSIIVKGSQKSALVILALGKNPNVLQRIAAIKDPVSFAVEIGKIEAQLKTHSGKKAPPPEKIIKSGTQKTANNTLDKLREEARKTGDMSKVMAYKRSLKA